MCQRKVRKETLNRNFNSTKSITVIFRSQLRWPIMCSLPYIYKARLFNDKHELIVSRSCALWTIVPTHMLITSKAAQTSALSYNARSLLPFGHFKPTLTDTSAVSFLVDIREHDQNNLSKQTVNFYTIEPPYNLWYNRPPYNATYGSHIFTNVEVDNNKIAL